MKQNSQDKNSKHRKFLSQDDPVPEDIHWEWLEVIKAIQAACKDNQGFAHLTLSVSVHKNKPLLWTPAVLADTRPVGHSPPMFRLAKLSPKRVAEFRFTSTTAAALMALHEES